MNEWSITDAAEDWRHHPVLGPATESLARLVTVVNRSSDGWAYWAAPVKACARLFELIERDCTAAYLPRFNPDREDATVEELLRAYRPIRAFLTRHGLSCELVEPREVATA